MRRIIFLLVVTLGKLLAFFSKLFRKGSGTTIAGYIIEKHTPWLLSDLLASYKTIICVSGTNGKTTTRALLAHLLQKCGTEVTTNRGGANLLRGVAASLVLQTTFLGTARAEVAVLEVEEASLPRLAEYARIDHLILTNIFRDQLDAYGEIEMTYRYFAQTLEKLGFDKRESIKHSSEGKDLQGRVLESESKLTKVYLNSNDGMLTKLVKEFYIPYVRGFEIELQFKAKPSFERQPTSGERKLINITSISNISFQNFLSHCTIKLGKKEYYIESQLVGVYNIYNISAALLVAHHLVGKKVVEHVADFQPVFGRGEKVQFEDAHWHLFLVKNPTGFDQVLQLLQDNFRKTRVNLVVCSNDNIADGRDVSWYWDINLEEFIQYKALGSLQTAGTRGLDMLLRFQYAGLADTSTQLYEPNLDILVENMVKSKQNYVVLCTYTALLELRKKIAKSVQIPALESHGN